MAPILIGPVSSAAVPPPAGCSSSVDSAQPARASVVAASSAATLIDLERDMAAPPGEVGLDGSFDIRATALELRAR
jgi:hypothetical protein